MNKHLVWLRADLRTIDNTALAAACSHKQADVAAVFFISPQQWRSHHIAGCRVDFELRTLKVLGKQLATLNIPLLIVETTDFASQPNALLTLCRTLRVDAVFYNKQYEINERIRDQTTDHLLISHDIACHAFDDQCIVPPGRILTGDGKFYSVFTPFKKNWLHHINHYGYTLHARPEKRRELWLTPSVIPAQLDGFTSHISSETSLSLWPAGEEAALDRLADFCEQRIRQYKERRDIPDLDDGTSRLSPYLAVGAISPRQCYQAVVNQQHQHGPDAGMEQWISELGWREFYKHLLIGFPRLCKHQPFRLDTRALNWNHDEAAFKRWCEGKTGFPLVDAAMRQLNTIGWMHNRLRMVVAMFLTKDLFIDWRWGERYFMEHLIDGDLAANNGGWQWSASTGNDAAPYFRIFNPARQSEKFDPDGAFIRRYVPELAHLDNKTIHEPHGKQRQLWLDYPEPMVDHKAACAYTISQFKELKEMPIGRAEND